uniref:Uncharacterized protein n=1 Tax=Zea mays TaxID=4577 RepID=A0A804N086_MAIZE
MMHNQQPDVRSPLGEIRGGRRIARRVRRRRGVGRRSVVRAGRYGQVVDAPLQHLQHPAHGRPAGGHGLDAPEPDERHLPRDLLACRCFSGASRAATATAPKHADAVLKQQVVVHPEREEELAAAGLVGGAGLGVAPPADHLQQQHPVAVHVGLGGDDPEAAGEDLRRDEADGAPRVRHRQDALLWVAQLGHPEVGDLGAEVGVQEHVLGLDVEVDDPRVAPLVQVLEPPRDARRDLLQRLPPQRRRAGRVGLGADVPVQRAVGHVLVHQRALGALEAEAQERDDVHVRRPADADHLVQELLAVGAGVVQDLDGDLARAGAAGAGGQDAAVHRPVAAFPELALEGLGYPLQLGVPVALGSE